jgi:hypothetical protein
MSTKCLISGLLISVLSLLLDFVVHGLLLGADYTQLPGLFRTEADQQAFFPFMIVAHLIFGYAFTWTYLQGKKTGVSALGQGCRFGLAVAALAIVPMYLIYYAVQPLPGALVAKQIVFGSIATVLLGIAVAYLNRATGET